MLKKRILKILALMMVMNILIIPLTSFLPQEQNKYTVHAGTGEVLSPKNLASCIMLVSAGIAGLGLISKEQTNFTKAQIYNVSDYINTNSPAVIGNINKLGIAINQKAEKTTIQALATGGVIYALLKALTNVNFNKDTIPIANTPEYQNAIYYSDIANYSSQFKYYRADTSVDLYYYNPYSQYFKGGYPLLHPVTERNTPNSDYWYYAVSNLTMPIDYKYIQIYVPVFDKTTGKWRSIENSSGKFLSNQLTITRDISSSIFNYDYEYVITIPRVSWAIDFFTESNLISSVSAGDMFNNNVSSTLENLQNISLPAIVPAGTVAAVNAWDGISELVIGLPSDYVLPGEDLIIVDPTTAGNPDIEIPIDPPVIEDNILGTVGKILTSILPISGLLDNIDSVIDGISGTITKGVDGIGEIAGTLTGGITAGITGIITGITDLTNSLTNVAVDQAVDLEPIKNIPTVIFNKFPFCIPWDFAKIIVFMNVSAREPPDINLVIPFSNSLSFLGISDFTFDLDFTMFNGAAGFIRMAELIVFSLLVMFKTKTLIWG